jgi:hypothetical protein
VAPTKRRAGKPSGAIAEILWSNTQELAEYAAKVALIGEATFGRNQFQGKAAVVQQGLCPVYAPRQNISVRRYSEISLKFAREVVAAQSGKTRQIFERDIFRKILIDEVGHHSP